MCGIYGYQWKPSSPPGLWRRTAIAVVLGINNAKRGTHSWGMYSPVGGVKKGLGSIVKVAHAARKFDSLLAHTRFATHGAKTVANAHPFVVGNIIGAHNGIIYNHEKLNHIFDRDFDVDSQHILAHLNEALPMKDLEGYGTCEWVDTRKPDTINLVKLSSGGELAIVETEFGVLWSSDKDHLEEALEAGAVQKVQWYKPETGKHYTVRGGELFYLKDSDLSITDMGKMDSRTRGIGFRGYTPGPYGGYEDDPRWGGWYGMDDEPEGNWKNEGGVIVETKPGEQDVLAQPEGEAGAMTEEERASVIEQEKEAAELMQQEAEAMSWVELRDMYMSTDKLESVIAQQEIDKRIAARDYPKDGNARPQLKVVN